MCEAGADSSAISKTRFARRSLERTTLSGFNQAFQIMFVGAGIMTVKNAQAARDSTAPVNIGLTYFVVGVLYAAFTWYTHIRRLEEEGGARRERGGWGARSEATKR